MSTLVLAVPSKGRLQENAESFFARAGLKLVKPRGAREYRGAIAGMPDVEVAYLSASDITAQLAQGAVHLGVTDDQLVVDRVAVVDDETDGRARCDSDPVRLEAAVVNRHSDGDLARA